MKTRSGTNGPEGVAEDCAPVEDGMFSMLTFISILPLCVCRIGGFGGSGNEKLDAVVANCRGGGPPFGLAACVVCP